MNQPVAPAPPSTPQPKAKRKRRPWIVGAVVGVLVIGGAASQATKKTEAPVAAVPAATTPTIVADEPAARPQPTDTQVRQIGLRLVDIQPDMAEIKVTRVANWSDYTCADIWKADPSVNVADRTAARFSGGDRATLTVEQGAQIVAVITEVYCHP